MIIPNVTLSDAQRYKSLLLELKPNWHVEIIEEDYNLYKLGFIREIPCSLKLDITMEQISELYDEITDMEASVYVSEGLLLKPAYALSEVERKKKTALDKLEEEYTKFAPLEGLCLHAFRLIDSAS